MIEVSEGRESIPDSEAVKIAKKTIPSLNELRDLFKEHHASGVVYLSEDGYANISVLKSSISMSGSIDNSLYRIYSGIDEIETIKSAPAASQSKQKHTVKNIQNKNNTEEV